MRDFKGYGARLPDVRWPGGARVAVSFVVNFEEGAEFSVSDGDPRNEAIYEVIDQQAGADPCIDTHFEYGTRTAWWRIADLFARFGAHFTLSSCGRAVERNPWLAQDALGRGHEVSAHGYRWQTHTGMDEATERDVIARATDAITQVTGRAPIGWHTRSTPSPNTRRLLVEQGYLYDSDAYNDDTPYFVTVGDRRHLVLPYAFDTNDMQFQNTQRFDTAASFSTYVCDAFDWLEREGASTPRMLSIGLHLRMIGRPGRMKALASILEHVANAKHSGGTTSAWIATREQIARHWIDNTAHRG